MFKNPTMRIMLLLTLGAIGLISVFFFWQNVAVISLILICLSLTKHILHPIRREYLWFLLFAVIGGASESFIITTGLWTKQLPFINEILLWLPLLWGYMGIIIITFASFPQFSKK